ncbi:hypothetical protein J7E87_34445 [Streptomyces sp. ISL-1]|uniref:hypothetical protein n=1 Tax=Streptomyces sp. ISL-1 TaxID=2817657 RepID=UPI001BE9A3B2|nr:hypothetical protein [Streptomyces sp. ISL-1]MBT2394365.1 hypothetical protein [Streptomyces sp. ISL-1]
MADLASRLRSLLAMHEGRGIRVPLGGQSFDVVVSAAGPTGRAAVAVMDETQLGTCGPVIEDPEASWLYWLVPPGTTQQWAPHPYGVCFGAPHTIALPPLARIEPPGAYWFRECRSDRLVPARPLWDLLNQFRPGPTPHAGVAALLPPSF